IAEVLNKKQKLEVSDEARAKSLRAFQDGLKDAVPKSKKSKRSKLRKQVIGFSSTIAAGVIAIVLAYINGIFNEMDTGITTQENNDYWGEQSEPPVTEENIADTDDIMEKVWNRLPFKYSDLENFQRKRIINDDFIIYLPNDWTVNEVKENDTISIQFSGTDG